jgi:hypothetical protein
MKRRLDSLRKAAPRVSNLLLMRGPATIFRTIPKIIINSIKRKSSRTISHIHIKVREVFPSGANSNTAKDIIFVLRAALSPNSSPHCNPTSICAGVGTNCVSMGGEVPAYNFFMEAAA